MRSRWVTGMSCAYDRTVATCAATATAQLMADHIGTIAGMGRQYFGPDKGFKSSLDRSARKAAWRMIRREEGLDDEL
ncbi:hypothetical protein G6W56_10780 [Streptomyces fungicidicus]|uniref:Uncharacterized protein n=1 Tax=Streptomyces fungicidicus TaxID=68203 RepID=A0ACC7XYN8_9ACTN|nr:hypothetical protein [Streptomyces fungicidicus]NUV74642.1 hypothetical protein [Streptomyces fungicidicus]